jgi:hypothetical protein
MQWGGWVQVKHHVSRIAVGSAVTLSLLGGSLLVASDAAAQCVVGYDDKGKPIERAAVQITGGTITNETIIDINANAGTAISDASGGWNNVATTGGGHNVDGAIDTASAGNGGVATSAADGGAISLGNINSGGNVGNAITVGDTSCAPAAPPKAPEKPGKPEAPAPAPEKVVVALPDTGVGAFGDASALFALIASAGAAVGSLGLRRR